MNHEDIGLREKGEVRNRTTLRGPCTALSLMHASCRYRSALGCAGMGRVCIEIGYSSVNVTALKNKRAAGEPSQEGSAQGPGALLAALPAIRPDPHPAPFTQLVVQ